MTNFVILYPKQDIQQIKTLYENLHLEELDTNILFIIDGLTQKEVETFVNEVNNAITYSCLMNTCKQEEINSNIEFMSGKKGDSLFTIKEGNVQLAVFYSNSLKNL